MIYLDANSTATLRPEAAAVISDLVSRSEHVRNPSSVHEGGREARKILNDARAAVLDLLGLKKAHVVFTSGGTEACSSLIHGFLDGVDVSRAHILTTAIEHAAVLEPIRVWERRGLACSFLSPTIAGNFRSDDFVAALLPNTELVSFMAANNETGIVLPVVAIVESLRSSRYQGPIVVDFTQVVGKGTLSVAETFAAGADAVVLSAHKIGAPSGVGAFVLNAASADRCFQFSPFLRGGAQEYGYRAGTENLLGIAAFGAAATVVIRHGVAERQQLQQFRDALWAAIHSRSPWIKLLTPTDPAVGLVNTLFVHCPGVRGDDAVVALDLAGVACSTGAACSSGKQSVSHVVEAMGYSGTSAREFLRLSLDWSFSATDAVRAGQIISDTLERVRAVDSNTSLSTSGVV